MKKAWLSLNKDPENLCRGKEQSNQPVNKKTESVFGFPRLAGEYTNKIREGCYPVAGAKASAGSKKNPPFGGLNNFVR